MSVEQITAADIHAALRVMRGWGNVYVPEFTWHGLRIDAALIDVRERWIMGFEVKVSRSDFLRDEKWQLYSQFCSSLAIVCPAGLIQKEEVADPFGLLYIDKDKYGATWKWEKKAKRFQRRDSLAWTWTYLSVLEAEIPRLALDVQQLRSDLQRAQNLNIPEIA